MEILFELVREFWASTAEMAPYLLLGFLVAGLLSVYVSPRTVERHLGGGGLLSSAKASIFGVPLPLCSCGVIPVAASLRQHGASRGATTSFLISTPQTGVDSILVTYSMLGPLFAAFRPFAALATGVLGGLIVSGTKQTAPTPDQAAAAENAAVCDDDCAPPEPEDRGGLRGALRYGFVTLPRDIGTSLLVGLAIAAAIGAFVPPDFAGDYGKGLWGMLAMLAVGVPLYVCATGSVPIAAALILKGVSPGAALVFLMTGPATNAATIATVFKVLGRRAAFAYLAIVVGGALLSGWALDALFGWAGFKPAEHVHEMGITWWHSAAGIALLAILGAALLRRAKPAGDEEVPMSEDTVQLSIEGMSCGHCVNSVERALRESAGVDEVRVSLDEGSALVRGASLKADALREAVEKLGYQVKAVETGA
jgi:hypothetical protein